MEILVILLLILLNGVLSMSEIALVSIRRSRLEGEAKQGDRGAKALLKLTAQPDRFLSMIQIGITLISILNGLFSGAVLDDNFSRLLQRAGMAGSWAGILSPIIIVVAVTYLTIVLGELVPKIIGLNKADKVARIMVKPIQALSFVAAPLVWLLSVSTNGIVKMLGIKKEGEKVTEDEIKAMVNEGFQGGEVSEMERDIVENAFDLDNVTVASVMTHRNDFSWININEPWEKARFIVSNTLYSVYPVCEDSAENLLGILHLKDFPLLKPEEKDFDFKSKMHASNLVPESMSLYRCLENFKRQNEDYAIVVDEYGSVQGIVTLHDIMEVLVGEITVDEEDEDRIVRREDGSLLVDGQLSFYEFLEALDIDMNTDDLPYQTIGGLMLDILENIPKVGEKVQWNGYTLEVMDMDGPRIDKLLVTKKTASQ
ncbi:MAG: hemolysin family protein [Bacteroidales bacterium]|nr:hemolysin family protein [Bacteroidales bacterium]